MLIRCLVPWYFSWISALINKLTQRENVISLFPVYAGYSCVRYSWDPSASPWHLTRPCLAHVFICWLHLKQKQWPPPHSQSRWLILFKRRANTLALRKMLAGGGRRSFSLWKNTEGLHLWLRTKKFSLKTWDDSLDWRCLEHEMIHPCFSSVLSNMVILIMTVIKAHSQMKRGRQPSSTFTLTQFGKRLTLFWSDSDYQHRGQQRFKHLVSGSFMLCYTDRWTGGESAGEKEERGSWTWVRSSQYISSSAF